MLHPAAALPAWSVAGPGMEQLWLPQPRGAQAGQGWQQPGRWDVSLPWQEGAEEEFLNRF